MENLERACIVCGNRDLQRSDLRVQNRFGLLHCNECGLSCLDLGPDEVDEESFDTYWDSVNEEIYTNPRVIDELSNKYSFFFRKLLDLAPGRTLLDVGSGAGIALAAARDVGFECTGLEPSDIAVRMARRQTDAKIICGLLAANDNLPRDFSILTLWDVIEHVPDPGQLIKDCADHLRENGIFMLETPDEGALIRRFIRVIGRLTPWPRWDLRRNIYYRAHRFYFTRDAMRRLLECRGFEQISIYSWHTMFRKELLKKRLYHSLPRWKIAILHLLFILLRYTPRSGNKMIVIAHKASTK